ncbi:MAG: hypothetical protein ACRELE_08590 [Gemmatimonadales bacterium]
MSVETGNLVAVNLGLGVASEVRIASITREFRGYESLGKDATLSFGSVGVLAPNDFGPPNIETIWGIVDADGSGSRQHRPADLRDIVRKLAVGEDLRLIVSFYDAGLYRYSVTYRFKNDGSNRAEPLAGPDVDGLG